MDENRVTPSPDTIGKGLKPHLRWLGYAGAVALVGFIVSNVDWRTMAGILRSADPWIIFAMVCMSFFQFLLSSTIWNRFLVRRGIHIPLLKLFRVYLAGSFFSTMLPTKYSGDVYRAFAVGHQSGRHYDAAASVLLERLSGMFVLLLMGFCASLFGGNLLANGSLSYPILMILGVFLTAATLLLSGRLFNVVRVVLKTIRLGFLLRPMGEFHDAVMAFADQKGFLFRTNVIAFFFKMFAFVCIYMGALALHIDAPFQAFVLIMPLIYVLEAVPVSIYGIGVREGGFVLFFTQAGLTFEQAFALSIVVLFGRLCCAAAGGVTYFALGKDLPSPAVAVMAVALSRRKRAVAAMEVAPTRIEKIA